MHRYKFIDSLRGVAACWVALFHFNEVGNFASSAYQTVMSFGWVGVTAFFVISGFVVHLSLMRSRRVGDFFSRRFWRIYPPYLTSLVVVLAVFALRQAVGGPDQVEELPHNLQEWLATLTLATSPVTNVKTINWVYWSLSYEAAFYLVLAATLFLRSARWPVFFALTIAALAPFEIPIFFLDHWTAFALGMAVAGMNQKLWARSSVLLALCLLDLFANREIGAAITAVVTAGLIWCCSQGWGSWLNKEPVLSRVGEWSYSLYLIHVPIGVHIGLGLLDPWPRSESVTDGVRHVTVDFAALVFCILAAYAFWKLIERPSQNMQRVRLQDVARRIGEQLRGARAQQE